MPSVMGIIQIILLCGITICSLQMVSTQQPTSEIDGSSIIGQEVSFCSYKAHQYLGVPYAEPPVGKLRFQKPQPFQYNLPEYKAFDNPPACLQYTTDSYPWYANTTHKSEDCLYVNIWTPVDASSENKKAVMYWMHGGGHRYGSIDRPFLNGTRMAIMGDIIVVTVNYRVGYFGFLTSSSSDAPGNVGIWDVLEGLKWVNKHIAAFGGDPSRITIAGEGAGAMNVGYLSISPLARGLYARQIMKSASPIRGTSDNKRNLALSQKLAAYVGCANDSYTIDANPKEVVQCLQGVDGEKISIADHELSPRSGLHLLPQFGDELLVEDPRISIIKGDFACTDLLIGNVKDPGSQLLTALEHQEHFGFFGEKNPHVDRSMAEEMIRKVFAGFPDPDTILNHYLPECLTEDTNFRIRTQAYTAMGDAGFLCPTIYYAEKCAEQNRNVYSYYFQHRPSNSPWAPWMGSTIFDDVAFVFGYPIFNPEYNYSEFLLSEEIVYMFASFVKNGNPGHSWPLYSKENPSYRIIGKNYTTDEDATGGLHTENCKFLKPYFGF